MPLLNLHRNAPQASRHLMLVLLGAVGVLAPIYWLDEAQTLRPTRVLGPVGLPNSASASPPLEQDAKPTSVAQATTQATGQAQPTLASPQAAKAAQTPPDLKDQALTSAGKPPAGSGAGENPEAASAAGAAPSRSGPVNARQIPLMPIEGVEHLKPFFRALARNDRATPVRVLHYGDSTLAGDGIAKTVRSRLKAQFGDGGPGFFVAGMDPRWMRRDDVRVTRGGEWDVYTILHGGNQGRYGLGGIVAKPRSAGQIQIAPARSGQMLGQRLEIYSQKARKPEALRIQINGQPVAARRIEHGSLDQWVIEHDQDIVSADVRVGESGLELYGLVAEAKGGLTWETTAVVGVSNGSFRQFNPAHLAEQVQTRKPDLIVIMLGGNDSGNKGILTGDGKFYQDGFTRVVQLLRQGAPQAACLIMSPLDQGALGDDGRIYSKRTIARIVELQRQISVQQGCAFWDTWGFMGGQNSFARWLEQGLAWTDLMHLTEKGLNRIGQGFSNAMMQSYEQHRSGQ